MEPSPLYLANDLPISNKRLEAKVVRGWLDFADLDNLQASIGYTFKKINRLKRALTRKSATEILGGNYPNNNQLTIIGDALLQKETIIMLVNLYSEINKNDIHHRAKKFVTNKSIFLLATKLELRKYVLMSKADDKKWVGEYLYHELSDVLEAIVAAVYYDSDQDPLSLKVFIVNLFQIKTSYQDGVLKLFLLGVRNEFLTSMSLESWQHKVFANFRYANQVIKYRPCFFAR